MKSVTVALAGNPNAGKTTMFNAITGARQHVGNYPGITVEKKTGEAEVDGETIAVVDLPGTYSLTAYSQEEVVARRMLVEEKPDVVLHVIDAGALERNLYLTVQLLELGIPVVIALNMMDEVRRRGDSIDTKGLSRLLDIPVVETVGRNGVGVMEALRTAIAVGKANRGKPWASRNISYGTDIDPVLAAMTREIEEDLAAGGKAEDTVYPARWLALKFLENDPAIREAGLLSNALIGRLDGAYSELARHLAGTLQTYPEATIADFRYGYIAGVLRREIVVRHADVHARRNLSDKVDTYLTHNLLGILLMAAVFYCVYVIAFSVGSIPMDWVDGFFGWLGDTVSAALPDGLLKSLLVSGIINGVGGIMTFVPLIFIMFLLIAFLEDVGYMARIAYMLDRVFRYFGLHGSSIMPYMISGGIAGGCAVPGVMATRTLRSPKEKLATMLTLPYMACGAKIPVFLLLVGAFFAEENQAAIMLSITLAGWIIALLAARVLRSTIISGPPTPFVMELPPYRLPTMRGLLLHTWERGWQYLKKAGTIILAISIVLWALLTFPALPDDVAQGYAAKITAAEEKAEVAEKALAAATEADKEELAEALEKAKGAVDELKNEENGERLRNSIAGRIGAVFEPVSQYAGFDWRTNIALLGGFAAKEVLVSTMGTAYSLGEVDPEEATPLSEKIKADPHWNKANAASLIIFVLIYAPCVVTIAAIRSETASWGWALFSLISSTVLAYGLAVAVFQIGKALL
ncbi:Ferrous iron transport protein B [uncultured delta proteobacterium]|uniref:Ferrous iron transport protein B n=1 Tax=uncultured delta proteobacterium TaxID=34034 RepID=A0A212KBR3_9DELT|nr:Ferrous iron transport protein B [uncultured delta proteobacterium]